MNTQIKKNWPGKFKQKNLLSVILPAGLVKQEQRLVLRHLWRKRISAHDEYAHFYCRSLLVPGGLAHPAEGETCIRADLDGGCFCFSDSLLHWLHQILGIVDQHLCGLVRKQWGKRQLGGKQVRGMRKLLKEIANSLVTLDASVFRGQNINHGLQSQRYSWQELQIYQNNVWFNQYSQICCYNRAALTCCYILVPQTYLLWLLLADVGPSQHGGLDGREDLQLSADGGDSFAHLLEENKVFLRFLHWSLSSTFILTCSRLVRIRLSVHCLATSLASLVTSSEALAISLAHWISARLFPLPPRTSRDISAISRAIRLAAAMMSLPCGGEGRAIREPWASYWKRSPFWIKRWKWKPIASFSLWVLMTLILNTLCDTKNIAKSMLRL